MSQNMLAGEMGPRRRRITGTVALALIAPRSKSQHVGIVLRTAAAKSTSCAGEAAMRFTIPCWNALSEQRLPALDW